MPPGAIDVSHEALSALSFTTSVGFFRPSRATPRSLKPRCTTIHKHRRCDHISGHKTCTTNCWVGGSKIGSVTRKFCLNLGRKSGPDSGHQICAQNPGPIQNTHGINRGAPTTHKWDQIRCPESGPENWTAKPQNFCGLGCNFFSPGTSRKRRQKHSQKTPCQVPLERAAWQLGGMPQAPRSRSSSNSTPCRQHIKMAGSLLPLDRLT